MGASRAGPVLTRDFFQGRLRPNAVQIYIPEAVKGHLVEGIDEKCHSQQAYPVGWLSTTPVIGQPEVQVLLQPLPAKNVARCVATRATGSSSKVDLPARGFLR